MKDTTLTELLDLMKAYAVKYGYRQQDVFISLFPDGRGIFYHGINIESFDSLPDLIDKLKK
jgi:hypothetical protein